MTDRLHMSNEALQMVITFRSPSQGGTVRTIIGTLQCPINRNYRVLLLEALPNRVQPERLTRLDPSPWLQPVFVTVFCRAAEVILRLPCKFAARTYPTHLAGTPP